MRSRRPEQGVQLGRPRIAGARARLSSGATAAYRRRLSQYSRVRRETPSFIPPALVHRAPTR
jgi:hypothetical protein